MLEKFLQDLVLQVDQPGAVDALMEVLKELKNVNVVPVHKRVTKHASGDLQLGRYDIFKMYPDRIVRIGFVRGAENAKRVLPSLNSIGDSVYFLHESGGA